MNSMSSTFIASDNKVSNKAKVPETIYSEMPTEPVKLLSILDGYITHMDDSDYNPIGDGGGLFQLSE